VLRRLFGIDPRSLALFRAALAALLLVDLAQRWSFLYADLSDAGYFPRALAGATSPLFELHRLSGAPGLALGLWWLALVAAAALLLGWHTRAATLAALWLTTSMQERNLLGADGGDLILRALLLWGVFLPLGARASLDARRAARARRPEAPEGADRANAPILSFASAGLLLQFAFVFAGAGLAKSDPVWRETGSAVQIALSQDYWKGLAGDWLLGFPELLRGLAFATVGFELAGPLLLFSPLATAPLRALGMLGFCGLMLGLGLGIELNLFPWCASLTTLPFLPAAVWDRLGIGLRSGARDPERAEARAPAPPARALAARAGQAAAALLLAAVTLANLDAAGLLRVPGISGALFSLTGTVQRWGMYGPAPPPWDPSFAVRGRRAGGGGEELVLSVPGAAPTPMLERFSNRYRFKSYLEKHISLPQGVELRSRVYLGWLCRALAAGEPDPARRYRELSLDFEPHRIDTRGGRPGTLREPEPLRVRRLATQRCSAAQGSSP